MIALPAALHAWPGEHFSATLKAEIEALPPGSLPLAEGGALGGYVDDDAITVTVIACEEHAATLKVVIGVFYGEILAGCSCGEDPETLNSYCELVATIDKHSAHTQFSLR